MSAVSKPAPALLRKRLTSVLIAASLCALLSACGNDDNAADASTLNSTNSIAESSSNTSAPAVLPTDPSAAAPAPTALTIQTPALPASEPGATLSAAAPAPLATPVIHTVD
jgi:hypothetical protein